MARKFVYGGGKIQRAGEPEKKGKQPAVPGDSPSAAETVKTAGPGKGATVGKATIGANAPQRDTMEEEMRELWTRSFGSLGNRSGSILATLPDGSRKVVQRGATGFQYNDPSKFGEAELAKMKTYKF